MYIESREEKVLLIFKGEEFEIRDQTRKEDGAWYAQVNPAVTGNIRLRVSCTAAGPCPQEARIYLREPNFYM
jgi:hypothetical protein